MSQDVNEDLQRALSRATVAESELARFRGMVEDATARIETLTEQRDTAEAKRAALADTIKDAEQARDRALHLLQRCRPNIRHEKIQQEVTDFLAQHRA